MNIPFNEKGHATVMKSIFWIQELAEKDTHGDPKSTSGMSLQVVMLDFFPRRDGFWWPSRVWSY